MWLASTGIERRLRRRLIHVDLWSIFEHRRKVKYIDGCTLNLNIVYNCGIEQEITENHVLKCERTFGDVGHPKGKTTIYQ